MKRSFPLQDHNSNVSRSQASEINKGGRTWRESLTIGAIPQPLLQTEAQKLSKFNMSFKRILKSIFNVDSPNFKRHQ